MDARLRKGVRLFNDGRFFECHEILEEFYRDTADANKPFLEGLIQLAAAFRLFCDFDEIKGPVRLIHQALIRFENFPPTFLQIRVRELCHAVDAWATAAEGAGPQPSIANLPKIQIQRFRFLP